MLSRVLGNCFPGYLGFLLQGTRGTRGLSFQGTLNRLSRVLCLSRAPDMPFPGYLGLPSRVPGALEDSLSRVPRSALHASGLGHVPSRVPGVAETHLAVTAVRKILSRVLASSRRDLAAPNRRRGPSSPLPAAARRGQAVAVPWPSCPRGRRPPEFMRKSRRRRAYPQQIVTTRLLYCLQDPFAHLSRLQRI